MLYTDCQSCRTAAIERHVSFAQITCICTVTKHQVSHTNTQKLHSTNNNLPVKLRKQNTSFEKFQPVPLRLWRTTVTLYLTALVTSTLTYLHLAFVQPTHLSKITWEKLSYSTVGKISKVNYQKLLCENFYRPHASLDTQITLLELFVFFTGHQKKTIFATATASTPTTTTPTTTTTTLFKHEIDFYWPQE